MTLPTRLITVILTLLPGAHALAADPIRDLQQQAVENGHSPLGHWGWETDNYMLWGTHSNRLVPVYTFGTLGAGEGIDLNSYTSENSPYRSAAALRRIYGRIPPETLFPEADYLDQTNIYDLQLAALRAKKKHIFLVVFDGMDWVTTRAAAIYHTQSVSYQEGRGTGLHFQDYQAGGTTQFAAMVTAPYADAFRVDVNLQSADIGDNALLGGYVPRLGGTHPWSTPAELLYLVAKSGEAHLRQPYTDSASSASSMTAGIKTYNAGINITPEGAQVQTIAHAAQRQGYRIGVITSVPISHATPAAAYAHNVDRDDYQDLTRDMLGLKSISHPASPLPGVDVLMGGGHGIQRPQDNGQGDNFIPGNAYLPEQDLQAIDVRNGGKYIVAQREAGVAGAASLAAAADAAIAGGHRLLGYYGVSGGHLPFRTADGNFQPTIGRGRRAETYTPEDILENPVLADFTAQALRVLSRDDKPVWMMVEAGDVDWANHDNNIDNSIGAVLSGDAAVKVITDWVETHSNWNESVLIVTADHGHLLVLVQPELLIGGPIP